MANNNIFEMYEKLMADSALFGDSPIDSSPSTLARYDPNDDESEDFLTSKEIVKMKQEHGEAEDGIVLPKGPVVIEEDVHFKRFNKRREHKYTETELEEIRKSCEATIVHDYGEHDTYHLSDEERAKNDSLNEMRMKLNGLKKMYRKIDQWIEAMRVVVEAWEILEKRDNYIHSTEEFFKMVSEGRIYSNSIIMPRMKGLDKYNMDLLIKYISNPELNPKDLVPVDPTAKYYDSFYDQFNNDGDEEIETEEETMERLLSPEEVDYILKNADNPPTIEVRDIKRKYIKGYDQRTYRSKKKKGKMSKKDKFITDGLHSLLMKIQNNPMNRDGIADSPRSYLITSSMFEPQKKTHDFWDDLRFDGSWNNKYDVFLYDLAVCEEMLKQHPVGDRYMTYADKELQEFFNIMEQNGINVVELRRRMNMSNTDVQGNDQKNKRKENKKTESALLQRLTKLNNNPKFKKLIGKAEKAINDHISEY